MSERREPTISTYAPSKEDAGRQQGGQQRPVSRQSAASSRSPAARPVVVQKKSILAPFAFLFALAACGAAGYLFWQLQLSNQRLLEADQRIASLESKFEMTDDEVNTSTEAMQAKLKWADSEIRKLWGVSYDTNRKAIKQTQDDLAKVAVTANSAKKAVDTKVQEVAAEVKVVSELVDAQQGTFTNLENRSTQMMESIDKLESAKRDLEAKVKAHEQAIEAIDAFRRQVNQKLNGGA